MGLRWDCDGTAITAPMGLRYTRPSRGSRWRGWPWGLACGVELQLQPGGFEKKANCNCKWRRRDATATATTSIQTHARVGVVGPWVGRGALLFLVSGVAGEFSVAVAVQLW
jgi:hypothetical protein